MAKTFTATWLGDGDPAAQAITEGGLTFVKGEPVKVPSDLSFNGMGWGDRIRGNPSFAVADEQEDDTPVDAGEEEERAAIMAQLDGKGVKYRANAKLDTLRAKLAE